MRKLNASRPQLNRLVVGLIAAGCLLAGAIVALVDSIENVWCAGFIRVGLVMGAFYLALPGQGRDAAWSNVSPYWFLALALWRRKHQP